MNGKLLMVFVLCFMLSNDEATGSALRKKRFVSTLGANPNCPKPGIGICVEGCGLGEECRDGKICCFNGCGHTCVDPVKRCRNPLPNISCRRGGQDCPRLYTCVISPIDRFGVCCPEANMGRK